MDLAELARWYEYLLRYLRPSRGTASIRFRTGLYTEGYNFAVFSPGFELIGVCTGMPGDLSVVFLNDFFFETNRCRSI